MRITLGRIIKKQGDYDSENIICPIENYNRDKYLNRRILIRIIFILLYGYGFGYMLASYFYNYLYPIILLNSNST